MILKETVNLSLNGIDLELKDISLFVQVLNFCVTMPPTLNSNLAYQSVEIFALSIRNLAYQSQWKFSLFRFADNIQTNFNDAVFVLIRNAHP